MYITVLSKFVIQYVEKSCDSQRFQHNNAFCCSSGAFAEGTLADARMDEAIWRKKTVSLLNRMARAVTTSRKPQLKCLIALMWKLDANFIISF